MDRRFDFCVHLIFNYRLIWFLCLRIPQLWQHSIFFDLISGFHSLTCVYQTKCLIIYPYNNPPLDFFSCFCFHWIPMSKPQTWHPSGLPARPLVSQSCLIIFVFCPILWWHSLIQRYRHSILFHYLSSWLKKSPIWCFASSILLCTFNCQCFEVLSLPDSNSADQCDPTHKTFRSQFAPIEKCLRPKKPKLSVNSQAKSTPFSFESYVI